MSDVEPTETFNPWSVVNLVFHHLAEQGLHPVLGETGDPAAAAADLLMAMGVRPGPDSAGPGTPGVQETLAQLRRTMMPGIE
ncbi:hypothetical protein [Pseudonocardia asaccharolytica]|uniref:Uncharacterized protein n=1 Tax=Pseudonocardia asaccharolytica DSM 44247 = NBRC 16224 TaxID=1123024 RepID=A0A511D4G7_9PSEU|nr:hypothetical protein [Pseudonocardia asaccharolytica]GEL19690.1 hypothetical protein PA7_35270 [Pseudonocardia asaccharolytica DSM 44247 = NBRC 16224]